MNHHQKHQILINMKYGFEPDETPRAEVDEQAIINEVLSRQTRRKKSKQLVIGFGCGTGCKDWESSRMIFK